MEKKSLRKMRIGIFPCESSENAYAERVASIARSLGDVYNFPSPIAFARNPARIFLRRYDYLILSWVENFILDKQGNASALRTFILWIYLFFCRIISKKLVWIRHNNYPHSAKPSAVARCKKLMSHLEVMSDCVITHSGHDAFGKRHYVPHPLYINPVSEENPLGMHDYFFIFGRISPYKKLEEAIILIPSHVNLVIAGPVSDERYFERCQKKAEGRPNIHLLPGFMDASVAARIARDSRGIVVLNTDEDMVVSGSYLFALGLGVPIFTISTPFIQWLSAKNMTGIHAFESIEALFKSMVGELCDEKPDPLMVESMFGDAEVLRALRVALEVVQIQ